MRRLLSIIISLITVMAFAQQPVESTSNESDPMLRIGKSYLGTRYVANTLDRNEVEQLVINTKEVDCLTFVEYTLAQALGSSFADNLQRIRNFLFHICPRIPNNIKNWLILRKM